jgi:hypothetical protein
MKKFFMNLNFKSIFILAAFLSLGGGVGCNSSAPSSPGVNGNLSASVVKRTPSPTPTFTSVPTPADPNAPCTPSFTTVFYAGQTIPVGTVTYSNTLTDLTIAINLTAPWQLSEVHLYAGTSPVPTNKGGNVAPGQFPYQEEFSNPCPSTYSLTLPLESLGVGCGNPLNIAVHAVVRKIGLEGEVVQQETAWANGTPFTGNQWGWTSVYTICCPPPTPTPVGCTLTQGYWKTHSKYADNASQQLPWPISEDTQLCGQSWFDILSIQPQGEAWLILAHQWIAAKLNVATGASTPPDVAAAITTGDQILTSNCVHLSGSLATQALGLATTLDNYNNGLTGPGHCQ